MAAHGRTLAALTSRGRLVVGSALILGLTGAALGERSLVQLAVFVLALPLLGAVGVARGRFRVTTRRSITPERVPRGASAEVTLRLQSTDTRRGGLWLLTEELPAALGRSPRFSLAGLGPGAATEVRYRLTGRHRGHYRLGPLRLRIVDPFGLVERTVADTDADATALAVVPRVRPLGRGGPGAGQGRGGEGSRRAIAVSGDDDVSVREYRQGDDLRKVHWRATARTGELMVRLEERPWRARGTLLLDTRARAHLVTPGHGSSVAVLGAAGDEHPPADSLEWLVEAAASIGVALAGRGAELRVVTDAGELTPSTGRGGLGPEQLLDRLAAVTPSRVAGLSAAATTACRVAGDGPLICLLGAVGPDDVAELAHLRAGSGNDLAVLLDLTGWAGAAPARGRRGGPGAARDALSTQREQAAAVLSAAGWRVTTARAGQDVAAVWAALGETPVGAPA